MSIYRYCPICTDEFVVRQHDGQLRQICPACSFVHYRNPVPAAGCLVVREGQVLMVQRKYPPYVGWWTLPAGFVEWEETPENEKPAISRDGGFVSSVAQDASPAHFVSVTAR